MPPVKIAVSLFILLLLGAQALFAFKPPHRYRYWPFLSYPMYNNAHQKDEPVSNFYLVGILKSGEEIPIGQDELKMEFWHYLRGPVRMAQRDDASGLLSTLQPFEHRARVELVAVRLENRPMRLENGKVVTLATVGKTIVLRHPE
jgi:hypothetical protein